MPDVKVYSKALQNSVPNQQKPKKTVPQPCADWRSQKRGLVINHEVHKLGRTFRDSFATLIISALGLVAALSWNDAIKSAITTLFPDESDLIYKFYIAIVVTVISVIITYFVTKVKTDK